MKSISVLLLIISVLLATPVTTLVGAQQTTSTLTIGVLGSPITGNFNYYAGGAGGAGFPPGILNIGTGYFEPSTSTWYPLFANATVGPLVNTTFAQIAQQMHYVNYSFLGSAVLNRPMLAYKWINFTIVPGIHFSDGEPLLAKDIILEMDLNEAPGAANMPPGTNVYKVQGNWTPGVSVNWATANGFWWYAPNNYTVSIVYATSLSDIRLVWEKAPMPWNVFSRFHNETALKAFKWTNPIGLGPWILQSWTSNTETFTNNPYWVNAVPQVEGYIAGEYAYGPIHIQKITPSVKTLVIEVFQSSSSAELALKSGEIQAAQINIPQINTVWGPSVSPTEHVWWFNTTNTVYLGMNEEIYPFNLTRFRQAIAYAINRTYIATVGEMGYGVPAPPVGLSWGMYYKFLSPQTRAKLNPYNTNLTKAKQILKSLGFTWNSKGQLMTPNGSICSYTLLVPSTMSDWETDGIIIANELAPLGITITVEPLTPTLLGEDEATAHYQMMIIQGSGYTPWSAWQYVMNPAFIIGYGTPQGPSSVIYPLPNNTKPNTPPHFAVYGDFVRFWNVTMANLFHRDNAPIDPAQRLADFNTMALIINQQMPLIPLFDPVSAFEYSTAQWNNWHEVYNVYHMTPGDSDFYGFVALFLQPVIPTYPVSITAAPSGGSIIINGTAYSDGQTASLAAGTYTVTAQPPSGMTFSGYGSTGSVTVASPTSSTTTITVSGAGSLSVAWKAIVTPVYASTITAPTLSSSTVTVGTPLTISVTATFANGTPAPSEIVNFYANGQLIGSMATNSQGVASITYTPSASGTYSITAALQSNPSVKSSSSATLSVSTPTNYALIGAVVVVIIVIIVAAAAIYMSRKGKGTKQQ
jgi:ABC-type transport system substrate-binding protein